MENHWTETGQDKLKEEQTKEDLCMLESRIILILQL